MKPLISLFSLLLSVCFLSFTAPAGAGMVCDKIPELNQQMLDFVKSQMNKKVGRGECWDLAAQGLNKIGANWDKDYGFGKEIDIKKECVFPGDIFQFEGVK